MMTNQAMNKADDDVTIAIVTRSHARETAQLEDCSSPRCALPEVR